jgi:curved DNA-binding protein CbpA
MNTHYDILGVPRSASDEAIKAAFHSAARACHPDLNAGDAVAEQKLKHIIGAYDALKSPERRTAYDQVLTERRRALARRFATSAVATLAGGAVVVLGVSLLSSHPYQQVASVPAASSSATEWERVDASKDRIASSSHSNASEPTKVVVREEPRVQEPMGVTTKAAVSEEPAAQDLPGATTKVVVREQPAAPNLEAVTTKLAIREEPAAQDLPGATTRVVVREDPAAQNPEAVTTKAAIREEPAVREPEGDTKSGHEVPAARKLTPATAVKRLAKGHDPVRSATAEIKSPALFGVAF